MKQLNRVIQSQEWPRVTKVSTGEMMLVMGEAEVTMGVKFAVSAAPAMGITV